MRSRTCAGRERDRGRCLSDACSQPLGDVGEPLLLVFDADIDLFVLNAKILLQPFEKGILLGQHVHEPSHFFLGVGLRLLGLGDLSLQSRNLLGQGQEFLLVGSGFQGEAQRRRRRQDKSGGGKAGSSWVLVHLWFLFQSHDSCEVVRMGSAS